MKRFVDLKEGDEVFVISDGECYKRKVIKKTMKWIVDNVMIADGSYKLIYGLTDEIDETRTCPGDYDIEITIENIDKNCDEPYKFSVDSINSTQYTYRDWFYVFSDFEALVDYRDWIYSMHVKPWDDIIESLKMMNVIDNERERYL